MTAPAVLTGRAGSTLARARSAWGERRSRPTPEPEPEAGLDTRRIYPLNLWSAILGIANLLCMATIPGLFGPDRDLVVLAFVPFHVAWLAVVAITRRTSRRMILAQCCYATFSVSILGMSAVDPLVTMVCLTVNILVPLSSAMSLSMRATRWLVAVAALGNTLMVLDVGGNTIWLGVSALAVAATGCVPALTVLNYRRRLHGAVDEARTLATTDPLTGLANRRGMAERMVPLVNGALHAGLKVGVLVADLDHFKKVNDRYGHAGGDEVLRRVAGVIGESVRRGDVTARLGGEELCVVVMMENVDDLAGLAERIRASVQEAGAQWGSTVSIGGVLRDPAQHVQRLPLPADLLWSLIDEADALLYEAKDAGRNRVRVRAD